MDLALAHVRSFVTLAEELHFGRAALRLGISQPQVSRHVRALEDELGVPLFTRTAHRTALTDAGSMLLEDARATLEAVERLRTRAASALRGGSGRVSVAFVWSTLGGFLAPLVGAAAEHHPAIELSVAQLRFVEILPALRRGDVDLAISRPVHEEHEMVETTLRREPSLLAVPEGHRFAVRREVPLEELTDEPMVALGRWLAPAAYDAVTAHARSAGVTLRIVQHVRSPTEALALVGAGIGVYRLPASAAIPQRGVAYVELAGALSRVVTLRRPEPPAAPLQAIAELAAELFMDAPHASNDGAAGLDRRLAGA